MSNFCLKKGQGLKILAAHLFGQPLLSKRTSLECPKETLWLFIARQYSRRLPYVGQERMTNP